MIRRRTVRSFLIPAVLSLALTGLVVVGLGTSASAASLTVRVTLYGYPDNSPPGRSIACPKIHREAGGTGTFDDPVTFATGQDQNGTMPCGTKIYVPYMKKYFIREDLCAGCRGPWTDLWAGGDQNSGQAVIACEDALTRSNVSITVNPARGLTVSTTPIFNSSTHACFKP